MFNEENMENMKGEILMIGILTFHNTTNFGASLQAYSLCKAIRSMGHECELVNYICPNIVKRERELSRSKNILKNIVKNILIRPAFLKKLENFDAHNRFGYDLELRYQRKRLDILS